MKISLVLLVAGFPLLFGCKKDSDDKKENPVVSAPQAELLNVAGNWTSDDGTTSDVILFNLTQNATSVTGTFNLNNGQAIGTITGAVTDKLFNFTLHEPAPCNGTFTGSAVMNGTKLEGNLKGSDCEGEIEGVFQMHKV